MILPTLRLYGPITGTGAFAKDISDRAIEGGWRRSIRGKGGFWEGSFTLFGDIGNLSIWFDNYLGFRFVENAGGVTWKGLIWDMLLVNKGVARRKSIQDIYNYVFATYINTDDPPQVVTSSAVQNSKSAGRFGQKEQLLLLDSFPQTAAEARRDSFLTKYAWPWSRSETINLRKDLADTYLEVNVSGDVATAQFRYESVTGLDGNQGVQSYTDESGAPTFTDSGQDFNEWKTTSGNSRYSIWVRNSDGSMSWAYLGDVASATEIRVYQDKARTTTGWNNTDPTGKTPSSYNIYGPVSEWIKDIIANDCEFLLPGRISENLLQTHQETSIPRRAWDIMSQLTDLGDDDGTPYWINVDLDGRVNYEPIPTTPRYFLRDGKLFSSSGGAVEINPWQVRPGVIRDMSYPFRQTEYNPWLSDVRDFYVSEVEVGVDTGLLLRVDDHEEEDILLGQMNYQAILERMRARDTSIDSSMNGKPRKINKYEKLGIPQDVWQSLPQSERYRRWQEYKRKKKEGR